MQETTVVIPHCGSLEVLSTTVELWKLQDCNPQIIVISTDDFVEIPGVDCHLIRTDRVQHPFELVAAANDLGQSLAQSPILLYTHNDCFPMRRDLGSWLCGQVSESQPVAGYQLTDRSIEEMAKFFASPTPDMVFADWASCVGHTLLATYAPTLNRLGVRWSWQVGRDARIKDVKWLDTEAYFNFWLKRVGIVPCIVGQEKNFWRNVDGNIDHVRSYTSSQRYAWVGSEGWREESKKQMASALEEAQGRVAQWKTENP